MPTNTNTQKNRALRAFRTGRDFTSGQIADRLGSSDSQARKIVSELRQDGYCIYRNRLTGRSGQTLNVYRLGTPSREMVSIVAKYFGSEMFS